jgi:transcriptional regulator with XRE-family HTH domain
MCYSRIVQDETEERLRKEIGGRLRALREALKWTQPELAERVRRATVTDRAVAVETLSKIEKGHHLPAAWMIRALAEALNTTADYILGLNPSPDVPEVARYPVPEPDIASLVARLNGLYSQDRAQVRSIVESILDYGTGSRRNVDVRSPNRRAADKLLDRMSERQLADVLQDLEKLSGEEDEGSGEQSA